MSRGNYAGVEAGSSKTAEMGNLSALDPERIPKGGIKAWQSDDGRVTLYCADALAALREMPAESVHCCVTSPPYYGLRDYGTAKWEGGDLVCDHQGQPMATKAHINRNCGTGNGVKNATAREFYREICGKCGARRIDSQIGLEPTPDEYVARLVAVFREVRRVLRDDGTLWLNLGDSYANDMKWGGTTGGKHVAALHGGNVGRGKRHTGLKSKDLIGIPWRVAFALQADGWYLRSEMIWHKPNPMPESVTDRPTKAHEQIFLLAKNATYYYDAEAVKEQGKDPQDDVRRILAQRQENKSCPDAMRQGLRPRGRGGVNAFRGQGHFRDGENGPANRDGRDMRDIGSSGTRNRRSVWTVATSPYPEAHFATFPPKLIEPCILAGTSEAGCCTGCETPWERVVKRDADGALKTIGWRPTCPCYDDLYALFPQGRYRRKHPQLFEAWFKRARRRPGLTKWATSSCLVFDPFGGAGTTAAVALKHERKAVLIELNPDYIELTKRRILAELAQARLPFTTREERP